MILIDWRDGAVLIVDGEVANPEPSAAVQRALRRPATVQRSVELPDGGTEEILVRLKPGEPGHVKAAMMALPGARLMLDDD